MKAAPKKSEETRERILEAALSLFRRHGFENATMREVAKEAGVALGAAYYYFDSKDAIVMAFYERAQEELAPILEIVLAQHKGLRERLHATIEAKLEYFTDYRALIGTLTTHIDPRHPLSPFSRETRRIREADIAVLRRAMEESKTRLPEDLRSHLPRVIWLYQMGLLLYWVYDSSPGQARTQKLFDRSLSIVVTLIKLSGFPLLRPVRKLVSDLMQIAYGEEVET